jgi:hypothetical protein
VSGRILIEEHDGLRKLRWRGVAPIVSRYKVPTLLLDATLPDHSVLQAMFPDIEIVGDISVDFPPNVHVRQYLGTPTSASKLVHIKDNKKKNPERHLIELRRHILRRHLELERQPTLVIVQKSVELWLKDKLPETISVAHYNAIEGLDIFKDVRLVILAGRTMPPPHKIENLTATLSGSMPEIIKPDAKGTTWYDRVERVIRKRDGTGRKTYSDRHPDPLAESVRKQVCEAQLEQAKGRGRGINRDEKSPLDIDLLFNECLSGAIDEVLLWDDQSELIETAVDGVMLTAAIDMTKIWPALWPNRSKADRTLRAGIPALPGFVEVKYQLAGPKMKRRTGYFDLNLIPDPRQWLTERLGPIAPEG